MDADAVQAGLAAERILNDAVFQSAIEAADAAFVEKWRSADNPEERERAHALQAALQQVVAELHVIVGRGQFEDRAN